MNRELTVPHTVVLPIELHPPIYFIQQNTHPPRSSCFARGATTGKKSLYDFFFLIPEGPDTLNDTDLFIRCHSSIPCGILFAGMQSH